jgi:hypothetical protein
MHFIHQDDFVSASLMAKLSELETYSKLRAEDIKSEIAREIFGELESVLSRFAYPSLTALGNVKVITAEGWHIRADDYRTIKKKYTEN